MVHIACGIEEEPILRFSEWSDRVAKGFRGGVARDTWVFCNNDPVCLTEPHRCQNKRITYKHSDHMQLTHSTTQSWLTFVCRAPSLDDRM